MKKHVMNYLLPLVIWAVTLPAQEVRLPAVAGVFYPDQADRLKQTVSQLLDQAKVSLPAGRIRALWVPHAGYAYSGIVAAHAYRTLQMQGDDYDAVVILAPVHHYSLQGVSIAPYSAYRTPLGDIPVYRVLADAIAREYADAVSLVAAHEREHVIEVQIPFLQTVLPGTPIVPIILGNISDGEAKKLARAIVKASRGLNILWIASSDLSHYPSYDDAVNIDKKVMEAVKGFDFKALNRYHNDAASLNISNLACALCGWPALNVVMRSMRLIEANDAVLQPYANSGDISGDYQRVVGYGAAVFCSPPGELPKGGKYGMERIPITLEEKKILFETARTAIVRALEKKPSDPSKGRNGNLKLKRGVFVTLTNKGQLRGCIGTFEPRLSLEETVAEMAVAAATQDYRFAYNPVTLKELPELDIKISILSERHLIDSIDQIEPGKHGVWVEMNGRGGTYLPEVAEEQGWDRIQLLEHLCGEKAGLAKDAYMHGAKIYIYTSQILTEK